MAESPDLTAFGQEIKRLREKNNISVENIVIGLKTNRCTKVIITIKAIVLLERAPQRAEQPTRDLVLAIAEVFGLNSNITNELLIMAGHKPLPLL